VDARDKRGHDEANEQDNALGSCGCKEERLAADRDMNATVADFHHEPRACPCGATTMMR
jgi:hypothetical protein